MFQISEVVLLKIVQIFSICLNFKEGKTTDFLFCFVFSVENHIFAAS